MAAPHVSGLRGAADAAGHHEPGGHRGDHEAVATDLGAAGRDNEYGYGLINPRAALRGMGLAK